MRDMDSLTENKRNANIFMKARSAKTVASEDMVIYLTSGWQSWVRLLVFILGIQVHKKLQEQRDNGDQ